ncbi:MAG: MBOAT family protein [Lachnospiraceae bacterium]|nr:MBOAT family protein [Lachnospiraceae bacterium]
MGITSFLFLLFFAVSAVLYYSIPKRCQWLFLLLISVIFFLASGNALLILYPLASITVTYFGAKFIEQEKDHKRKKWGLSLVVVCNLGILVALKYLNLGIYTYNALAGRLQEHPAYLDTLQFLIPLGVSFYTLSILSYVFDVYYEIIPAEKKWAKLFLFGIYFPTIISGPIMRYKDMKDRIFAEHAFDYNQITKGLQRILWGFFKVLVISERLAVVVSTVYDDYETYGGCYIIFATLCFSLQLYANFSGAMDIVLGVSQVFGIKLPENFQTPFFSKTIQEFWRRWHITLGAWLKDYIFYPVLRTNFFMELPGKLKPRFGKKTAKRITTFSAMFILWFAVGLWHGGAWKYIIGSGIIPWIYIVGGELAEPIWVKLRKLFSVNKDTKWFSVFQMIRTFLLMSFAFLFFNSAGFSTALSMIGNVLTTWNPEILWNGGLLQLGLEIKEWLILLLSLSLLWSISVMQQKGSVREWLGSKNIVLRWTLLYALLFWVILMGNYGPGYSAAEFIYQGF